MLLTRAVCAALPNDVLEAGLYDGTIKSSLIMPYMEAVQRRMLRKGWTQEQLMAIKVRNIGMLKLLNFPNCIVCMRSNGLALPRASQLSEIALAGSLCLRSTLEAALVLFAYAAVTVGENCVTMLLRTSVLLQFDRMCITALI